MFIPEARIAALEPGRSSAATLLNAHVFLLYIKPCRCVKFKGRKKKARLCSRVFFEPKRQIILEKKLLELIPAGRLKRPSHNSSPGSRVRMLTRCSQVIATE